MARIQILELPTIYREHGDDETPFVLVIDEFEPQRYAIGLDNEPVPPFDGVAEQVGARAILVFQETVEIPANNVPVGPDGYPIRLRVEGDFERFREQVEAEVLYAQGKITRPPVRPDSNRPTHPDGTPYRYFEIKNGGWDHCDGCQTWGQWTAAKPHQCIAEQAEPGQP